MTLPQSIALTGADGFVGWHLRCRLKAMFTGLEVRAIGRREMKSARLLRTALTGAGAVIHLAGANRGSDDVLRRTNVELADDLVQALDAVGGQPRVAYANSAHAAATHTSSDSAYGSSKRDAGRTLQSWGQRSGAPVANLMLPNLFGECARPRYNSAVATFCADLAAGRPSEVNGSGTTELMPVQDACAVILESLSSELDGCRRVEGGVVAIPEVYARLRRLHAAYGGSALPPLHDRLDLLLFNALRTAMYPGHYPMPLTTARDARGGFSEVAKGSGQTQTSFSTTAPGFTRGEHFHFEKIERFAVVSGKAVIRIRRLFSSDIVSFAAEGGVPVVVDMPPLHAHNITNIGSDPLVTIFWTNDHFNPGAPDTFAEPVDTVLVAAGA